jgi:hypothetical protein
MLTIPGPAARNSALKFCAVYAALFPPWTCGKQAPYMKTREEVLAGLGAAKTELQQRFKVRTLALFGSYARNQQTERS